MLKILVTGADGTLGQAFKRHSKKTWPAEWRFYNHAELDVSNDVVVRHVVRAIKPDVVINCAACNDVDATSMTEELRATNVNGPCNLAKACRELSHSQCRLVHFSTNYVYGEGESFNEESITKPWNYYATSKVEGEMYVQLYLPTRSLILRTSWIFGYPGAKDFVRKLGASGMFAVDPKQVANPTFAGCLVDWTKSLLERNESGIFNAVNNDGVDRQYFAQRLSNSLGLIWNEKGPDIVSGEATVPRPKICTLNTNKLAYTLGVGTTLSMWWDYLDLALTGTDTQWLLDYPMGLERHVDTRGSSMELFRSDESQINVQMGYASWNKPGVVRGPHQHMNQSELLVVPGPATFEIYLWPYGRTMKSRWYRTNQGTVLVPNGCVHAYRNISDGEGLIFAFPDQLYKGNLKTDTEDIVKWENRVDSPYELPDFSLR